jgi:hypothetical protein
MVIQIPRTDTKERPVPERSPASTSVANRLHPRGSTPPAERLIVPKDERAEAEAQLDRALADLTVDRNWADLPDDGDEAPPPRAQVPARPPTEEPEISIEAGEPPLQPLPAAPVVVVTRGPSIGDASEPEISIERLVEIEVDSPLNEPDGSNEPPPLDPAPVVARDDDEPSSPEILVMRPGRAITADDAPLAAGAIEEAAPAAPPKRAKRQTDAPD